MIRTGSTDGRAREFAFNNELHVLRHSLAHEVHSLLVDVDSATLVRYLLNFCFVLFLRYCNIYKSV